MNDIDPMYNQLPSDVIQLIYEYDPTYQNIFDYVLIELVLKAKQREHINKILRKQGNVIRLFLRFVTDEII